MQAVTDKGNVATNYIDLSNLDTVPYGQITQNILYEEGKPLIRHIKKIWSGLYSAFRDDNSYGFGKGALENAERSQSHNIIYSNAFGLNAMKNSKTQESNAFGQYALENVKGEANTGFGNNVLRYSERIS